MLELGIDKDLVWWISFLFTNRKLQLTIDGYTNQKKKINTRISQGSLLLPIFFLVYVSRVFVRIQRDFPILLSLLFAKDLGFIAKG